MGGRAEDDKVGKLDVDQWVDEHADALFRYAMARVGHREVAEELVQETFVSALKGREGFSGRSSERTWLVGILRHKIVDHHRRAGRNRPQGESEEALPPVDQYFHNRGHWKNPISDWRSDPVELLANVDFWRVFHRCFAALPETLAQAFALREMEDLASPEVCERLQISESNLWVRLYRARVSLKECLEGNWFQKHNE